MGESQSAMILFKKFGVPKSTLCRSMNVIFSGLKCSSMNHLWDIVVVFTSAKKIVREVIAKTVVNTKIGKKTCLSKNKEAYIVTKSEIDGSQGPTRNTNKPCKWITTSAPRIR